MNGDIAVVEPDNQIWAEIASRLAAIGYEIRHHIGAGRSADDAVAVEFAGGDIVYAIDRRVEPIVLRALEAWPAHLLPLVLVAEGLGGDGSVHIGPADQPARFRVIIDPIDGTRELMYDKRAAWFLAAAAPERGAETRLSDSCASVLLELPTSKQGWADCVIASTGTPVVATRRSLTTSADQPLPLRSSDTPTLAGGFGQVSSFFPGTKELAASLMERIVARTVPASRPGTSSVFEDQYISTGGQWIELMTGKDRFCCDLRPIFYDILRRRGATIERGLECHPYDAAGLFAARSAGVILTDGFGAPLDAPLDVETGVHWIGYANAQLQALIAPVIQQWIDEQMQG